MTVVKLDCWIKVFCSKLLCPSVSLIFLKHAHTNSGSSHHHWPESGCEDFEQRENQTHGDGGESPPGNKHIKDVYTSAYHPIVSSYHLYLEKLRQTLRCRSWCLMNYDVSSRNHQLWQLSTRENASTWNVLLWSIVNYEQKRSYRRPTTTIFNE